MTMTPVRVLTILCALLVAVLAALWFDGTGMRNLRWRAPAALVPDTQSLLAPVPARNASDVARFNATIERPLFSPSRRPPLPAPSPAEHVADPFADLQLKGLFTSGSRGGVIAIVEGKSRRIHTGEKLGEWTLSAIEGRDLVLARGDERKRVTLKHALGGTAAPVSSSGAEAPPGIPTPSAAALQAAAMTPQQRIEQRNRERLTRRNELRAQHGLPPISQ